MSKTLSAALLAVVLGLGAVACGGDPPATEESPSAVPGMGGETQPSMGPGESDPPDTSASEAP